MPIQIFPNLMRRVGPVLALVLALEAVLYVVLDRSDTLHDLFLSPAIIVAVVGLLAVVARLRGRTPGDRRGTDTRRRAGRRDDGSARPDATRRPAAPLAGPGEAR